jgi:hypothetical protein
VNSISCKRLIPNYNYMLLRGATYKLQWRVDKARDRNYLYLIHPVTALYLGYTDRTDNLLLFPRHAADSGTGFPSTTKGRGSSPRESVIFSDFEAQRFIPCPKSIGTKNRRSVWIENELPKSSDLRPVAGWKCSQFRMSSQLPNNPASRRLHG